MESLLLWLWCVSLLVNALVRASRPDVPGPIVPAPWRPYLAVILGALAGVVTAHLPDEVLGVVYDRPLSLTTWALLGGAGGGLAVAQHQAVAVSLLQGKGMRGVLSALLAAWAKDGAGDEDAAPTPARVSPPPENAAPAPQPPEPPRVA